MIPFSQEKGEGSGLKSKIQPFSYAVIDNKPQPVRDFFAHHEGVHLFSWQPSKYGFGVMDRYLECLLRCTNLAAALSQCKVLLFNPQTSPLFLVHEQEVDVVGQRSILDDYLPEKWGDEDGETAKVLKSGVYLQVRDVECGEEGLRRGVFDVSHGRISSSKPACQM